MPTLSEHLENDEIILLDAGITTEIQKQGVALDTEVWAGIANKTHPDVVRKVHEEYIRAGAQVITANTYSTARHVLDSIDLGDEVKSLTTKAIELAKVARDNVATGEIWIAGSMSSMAPLNSSHEVATGKNIAANYREMAEILKEAGVDLIIAEMMREFENAPIVIEAALATGLPVWVGYSAMLADDGVSVMSWRTRDVTRGLPPDDFEAIVEATGPLGGAAAGIMHSQVAE